MVDLVHELEGSGNVERLAAMDVVEGLGYLWPRLQELTKVLPARGPVEYGSPAMTPSPLPSGPVPRNGAETRSRP